MTKPCTLTANRYTLKNLFNTFPHASVNSLQGPLILVDRLLQTGYQPLILEDRLPATDIGRQVTGQWYWKTGYRPVILANVLPATDMLPATDIGRHVTSHWYWKTCYQQLILEDRLPATDIDTGRQDTSHWCLLAEFIGHWYWKTGYRPLILIGRQVTSY